MSTSALDLPGSLHHAYLVVGSSSTLGWGVRDALKKRGVSVASNPDVLQWTFGDLLVDDARMITERAFLKSVGEAKYFVISFERAGIEAQNALLKVVEEAPGNTHFFFCVESPGTVIPTLRSRCMTIGSGSRDEKPELRAAQEFLALGYADRLAHVEKMLTTMQRSGDRAPARVFVRALVRAHPSRSTLSALQYLERAVSPKLVLAHLAVALPKV